MYTWDVAICSLSRFSDESTEFPSSLLTERLLDGEPAPGERSGDAEWEAQLQPESPLQQPRAWRIAKESTAAALSLIYTAGMAHQ